MKRTIVFLTGIAGAIIFFLAVFPLPLQADYKYDYYDYQEMVTLLKDLETQAASKNPNVYSLQVIGYSYQNNPIYAVKFSDNPDQEEDDEPDVVIDGGIHGNEWLPVDSNLNFIQYLFDAYYNDTHPDHDEVVDLVNNFEIWIIPMINVDGRIRDDLNHGDPDSFWIDTTYHAGDNVGWRMNVQEVDCPAMPDGTNQGIDINRTFSYKFWELSDCTKTTYNGGTAFAAPESRVLKDFINNHMVSLLLHQHSNLQVIYGASDTTGLGDYISLEADTIYDEGLPNPLMALTNGIEFLTGGASAVRHESKDGRVSPQKGSGVCGGSVYSGQYFEWLWEEIDCILAPDNHSRRAIQNIFYEYAYIEYTEPQYAYMNVYGYIDDGKVGQHERDDGSNGFHPSSGAMNQWIIEKSVEMNKYLIKQSRYPFSPRYHADMSWRPEAPNTDLAIVGAKISEVGDGLPGCLTTDTNGRDLLAPGTKRITWNVQNNGTGTRTVRTEIEICAVTVDECSTPFSVTLTKENVPPEKIETFTYEYSFEPLKDYWVTLKTIEAHTWDDVVTMYNNYVSAQASWSEVITSYNEYTEPDYENDLKRFVLTTLSD